MSNSHDHDDDGVALCVVGREMQIISLTNFILGLTEEINCIFESGDVFTDDLFNVQDIVTISQFVVGVLDTLGAC